MGRPQRTITQTVVSTLKRNNPGFASLQKRSLQCRLNRFETRIAKDRFSATRFGPSLVGEAAQFPCQVCLAGVWMHIPHRVAQGRHLILPGANDLGIRMSRRRDSESRRQIQILLPLRIPDMAATGLFPNNRPVALRIHVGDVPRFVALEEFNGIFVLD